MKKVFSIILAGIISFLCVGSGYAADVVYRITNNDQDSLIIGEVTHIQEQSFALDVMYIVSGKRTSAEILVNQDNMAFTRELEIGDFVLASLNRNGEMYDIEWGLYKIKINDQKINIIEPERSIDDIELEYYVNSGAKRYTSFYDGDQDRLTIRHGVREYELHPNMDEALIRNTENGIANLKKPKGNMWDSLANGYTIMLLIAVCFVSICLRLYHPAYDQITGKK